MNPGESPGLSSMYILLGGVEPKAIVVEGIMRNICVKLF